MAEYPLGADSEGRPEAPRLKIIEWRRPVNREFILCDVRGMPLARLKPEIQAPGFDFTAYVSWSGFERSPDDLMFADWTSDTEEAEVVAAARERLRMHFRMRAEQRRQEIVQAWRDEGVYPYSSEPADGRERAERETFDTVATTVVKHLPKAKSPRRAILGLLRSAVAHEPTHTVRLLEELFSLTKQEQADLARLLDRTRLSSLIQASTAVTDRFDFLAALELLIFEPELKGRLRERTELHRILENESWVFGEEYGLFVSDRSLTEVLRRHCALLERGASLGVECLLRQVGRGPGRSGRPVLGHHEHVRAREQFVENRVVPVQHDGVFVLGLRVALRFGEAVEAHPAVRVRTAERVGEGRTRRSPFLPQPRQQLGGEAGRHPSAFATPIGQETPVPTRLYQCDP